MTIKFQKILAEAIIPRYVHHGDAGMDIFSAEDAIIKARERKNVKTGVKMELPEGFVGLVWDKSGLALKNGIKTMAGVIDSGYRGEIGIVLVNLSDQNYKVEKGQKIAQMLIQKLNGRKLKRRENWAKPKEATADSAAQDCLKQDGKIRQFFLFLLL